jgi:hypothetical protein
VAPRKRLPKIIGRIRTCRDGIAITLPPRRQILAHTAYWNNFTVGAGLDVPVFPCERRIWWIIQAVMPACRSEVFQIKVAREKRSAQLPLLRILRCSCHRVKAATRSRWWRLDGASARQGRVTACLLQGHAIQAHSLNLPDRVSKGQRYVIQPYFVISTRATII